MTDTKIADLRIYKTVDDTTPRLGQEITWTIEVRNDGPDTASNVLVSDLMPEGVSLIDESPSTGSFSQSSDTWSIGHLAPGDVEILTLTTVVDRVGRPIGVRSTVSTDSHDCNPDNNTHIVAVTPWKTTYADLHLTKAVNNDSPAVGTNVAWTLSVTNDGPDTAWNTVINDELPSELSYISSTNNAYDAESGVWNVGHLKSGESAEIEVITSVDGAAGANFVNRAVASSSAVDSNPDNNAAEASIAPVAPEPPNTEPPARPENKPPEFRPHDWKPHDNKPDHHDSQDDCPTYQCGCLCSTDKEPTSGADLQINKWVSNPTPDHGSEVIWTIVVENNGPDDAENVVVYDSLPGGLQHSADNATVGEFNQEAGVWSIGDLASGSSAVLQITTIATDAEFAQVNIALVTSDTEDSNPDNNIDHASINAVGADLAIEKTVSDIAPDLGDSVTWTINVTNKGPDTAENVTVEDTLPGGVTFQTASSDNFNETTGLWTIGDLASGESVSLDIDVSVDDADGARINIASVSSDTPEIDPSDNSAEAQTDAVSADLELDKGVIPGQAAPGDTVTWELTVTNRGPDDATGIVVEDILPEGLSYDSDNQQGSTFDFETGQWAVGDLESGSSTSITINATVISTGEITNTAQIVAADQFDPDSQVNNDDGDQSEDDEANATLTVPSIIDLELSQTLSDEDVLVGDTVTFTIEVTNASTVDATGVSVSNAGLPEYVSNGDLTITAAPDIYNPSTGQWEIGDLAAGATMTLQVEAVVNNAVDITNEAQIQTADQDDIDSTPGNNAPDEDDQDPVVLMVTDPGPSATDDIYSITPDLEPTNAVFMIDHSGSMGTLSDGPDKGSSLGADIPLPNGGFTSRIQLIRDAVVDIAEREQVSNVKILGFDGSAQGADNISGWFDVSGSSPDTAALESFLDAMRPSGWTNYVEALETSINYTDQTHEDSPDPIPTGVSGTNYYFLTDGNPLLNGDAGPATPTAADEQAWQDFVDSTFDDAYAIGFGPGVTNFESLAQVAHSPATTDNPAGLDDPNVIIATEADDIPAELYNLIANSQSGNVLNNDSSGGTPTDSISITELTVGTANYSFDGSNISVTSGNAPNTTLLRSDTINTPTEEGGRLEFNFTDGSFEYFAPYTETAATESFEYTISDTNGNTDTGTLSIDIEPIGTETTTLSTTSLNPQPLSEEEAAALAIAANQETVPALSDPQLALLLDDQSLVI